MAVLDFSRRNALSELMDADDTDFQTFRACLIDLSKVNALTLAYRPTLAFFKQLTAARGLPWDRRVSVVDVGSGSGDMLRRLDRWSRAHACKLDLVGVDLNPWSAVTARQMTNSRERIRFVTANIFDYQPEMPIDIVISSLFTHHLDDAALIAFVRWMEANARIGWFINDLYRHPVAYHLFRHASRTLGFHHFVQHDGPISIARAFSPSDWRALLQTAEIPDADIKSYVPFRLCVSRIKSW
ncbi:methyltransferase domain-containing protein [uncultured Methylovirgula sp.]|uniref:methyltransferase domain-containing protein n=1 Tax=uncultured Methylovirgula sp. TaxID=1285960 RepID=UPI0026027FEF|nr:methyltransferase domain-containing protein [uncultured Methylovirgula sp.]